MTQPIHTPTTEPNPANNETTKKGRQPKVRPADEFRPAGFPKESPQPSDSEEARPGMEEARPRKDPAGREPIIADEVV